MIYDLCFINIFSASWHRNNKRFCSFSTCLILLSCGTYSIHQKNKQIKKEARRRPYKRRQKLRRKEVKRKKKKDGSKSTLTHPWVDVVVCMFRIFQKVGAIALKRCLSAVTPLVMVPRCSHVSQDDQKSFFDLVFDLFQTYISVNIGQTNKVCKKRVKRDKERLRRQF